MNKGNLTSFLSDETEYPLNMLSMEIKRFHSIKTTDKKTLAHWYRLMTLAAGWMTVPRII